MPTSYHFFDINQPNYAYIFGFLLTDGSVYYAPPRGSLLLELNKQDGLDILPKFQKILPVNSNIHTRLKTTNFKIGFESLEWRVNSVGLVKHLKSLGLPSYEKTRVAAPPVCSYSEPDFWRGVIDGDGSVGITGKGLPFISLCTQSRSLVEAWLEYTKRLTGVDRRIVLLKNGTYDPVIWKEEAQQLISTLYYTGCIALARKRRKAEAALTWRRPASMIKRGASRTWRPEDIALLNTPISNEEAATRLGRTLAAIKNRRYVLNKRSHIS